LNSLDLYRQARRAAAWGIVVSLGLGLVKLLGGVFGHSLALVSDAVHSLVDAAISAALLGALLVAQRPADNEHPYGHARFEAVAGSGVALLLILLALGIGREAIGTIGVDRVVPSAYTLGIALGGALVQEFLYRYARKMARESGSTALLATAWDYRLDALGSVAVVAGVALACWGGPPWHWADHAAALVVAVSVMWVGGTLLWGNIQDLMDRQADPELLRAVRSEALAVEGVLGVETLRVRKVGLEYLVDIHVEVDPERSVKDGHAIAHAVKDRVINHFAPIRDVLVHVEPSPDGRHSEGWPQPAPIPDRESQIADRDTVRED
jgi:cation diffusion facilitator family transporter